MGTSHDEQDDRGCLLQLLTMAELVGRREVSRIGQTQRRAQSGLCAAHRG